MKIFLFFLLLLLKYHISNEILYVEAGLKHFLKIEEAQKVLHYCFTRFCPLVHYFRRKLLISNFLFLTL